MKRARFRKVVWLISLFVLLVAIGGLVCVADEVKATKFDSNGDLIQDWYWLRDAGLQHYAEWTFTNVPSGTSDLVIAITALATNRANGGRGFSARFRLLYGFPGSGPMGGVFTAQEVTLPNVSPPSDPVGYTCKGQVTIPRSALHGGSALFLRVERISPTDNHVAFNKDSMVILTSGATSGTGGQNDAGSGGDVGNDKEHAYHINTGTTYQGFLKPADNYDYYSFEASAGQIISVTLTVTSDVEFQALLRAPNGSSGGAALATQDSPGKIEYVAGSTGTWIIEVNRGSGEGNYTLRVDTTNQNDAGSGGDVGNDKEHAYHINTGTTYQGFLKPADNYDYYSFEASASQIISVTLTVTSDVEFQVYLRAPNGSSGGAALATQDSPGKIEYVAGSTGTWIIEVHRGSGEGNYTLTLAPPSYQATDFHSTGNLIDSWSWLQDNKVQHSAEWTFAGIAPTTTNLSVRLNLLASGIAAGTTEVHLLLAVGFSGAAPVWAQEVSIPVIGPATGASGVLCQGSVQIPVPPQYVAGQSALVFQLHRVSAKSPRIAVNKDSMIIQAAAQGAAANAELQSAGADSFHSNGDLIQRIYWCRRQGQFLEWTWNLRVSVGTISEAAVNFELLVTNKVNGGSGWGTTVQMTLLDLAGNVITVGQVELVNPFRPQFSDDSHGIGYKTCGVLALPDPNLVRTGFRLRISWPPVDGSGYHFGGAKDRALLAFVRRP